MLSCGHWGTSRADAARRYRVSDVARCSGSTRCSNAEGLEDCGPPAEPQRVTAPTDQE